MSLSLIIILLLIVAYRTGARKGLVQTVVNVVGYIVVAAASAWLAHEYGPALSSHMPQIADAGGGLLAAAGINLNSAFYQILLFWILTIGLGIGFRMVSGSLLVFTKLPVISQLNRLLGGVASFLLMYAVIFFGLILAGSWPNAEVRAAVDDSAVAEFILNRTPGLSERIFSDWLPLDDV